MTKDPYQVLGVQPGAAEDEIRQAYRRLAKQYHPDLNPGDELAAQKMNEINEAYELLKNPQAYYQQQRQQQEQQARQQYAQQSYYDPFGFWAAQDPQEDQQQSYRWTYTYQTDEQDDGNRYQWNYRRPRFGFIGRMVLIWILLNLIINLASCGIRFYTPFYYEFPQQEYDQRSGYSQTGSGQGFNYAG